MDLGNFALLYPELIIERARQGWSGELLEFYDIQNSKWQPLAEGAEAQLFRKEDWQDSLLVGLINSVQIRELDCALIAVQEAGEILIGLVRGKDIKISGEEEIEFSAFADLTSKEVAENVWSPDEPDPFDVSEDLQNLLE